MGAKQDISGRHREEWRKFREEILYPAIESRNEAEVKLARGIADVYKITQEGERKAYGFADGEPDGGLDVAWEE